MTSKVEDDLLLAEYAMYPISVLKDENGLMKEHDD
eukprot:CAMPEP_0201602008 /NCGR_PEP_ID=MMETSP0492-20130828/2833_1 /ASSEMBLY_ACC=CAM_ASM_000837 /TAXON_ID=420259 /ORGANISM="Thalassiosira gravida, Strain GMp14c1" /LENGTH=34 /DNA_ID= /DNA_START= /DNA_END= /DNA_ORIENTATION=